MAKPNWDNRTLFHGDNLDFMRAMNSNTVDLIATDPPFNKGRDFHATPDSLAQGASFQDRWSWEKDVHQEWVDQITDDHPNVMNVIEGSRLSYGDDIGAFLCFMGVRLLAMKRVLKDTGSIYLHCDPTASHYLKELMDSIFGKKNFINEIIWCYASGGVSRKYFGKKHDTIFMYSKSKSYKFNTQYRPYSEGTLQRGLTDYKKKMNKKYELKKEGAVMNDWWTDIAPLLSPTMYERTGYPTQKPLALYGRIIEASSNKGDIVFDPFAGCATTCVAAEKLGRKWVGIDIWDKAYEVVVGRIKKECYLDEIDKERKDILLSEGTIICQTELPKRTDGGDIAAPFLRVKEIVKEPEGKKMSRAEMVEYLIKQHGAKCQGCDRMFDDQRYLELDHNTPRADGGINHISNRILLCSPCNKLKSNILTLSGLRRENKKLQYMVD